MSIHAIVACKRPRKGNQYEPDLPAIADMGAADLTAQTVPDIAAGRWPVCLWDVTCPDAGLAALQGHAGLIVLCYEQTDATGAVTAGNMDAKLTAAQRTAARTWLQNNYPGVLAGILNSVNTTSTRRQIVGALIETIGDRVARQAK